MSKVNLQVFNNSEFGNVEVLELKGEIFFNASNVGSVLDIKNIRQNIDTNDIDYALHVTNKMIELSHLHSIGGTNTNRNLNNRGELSVSDSIVCNTYNSEIVGFRRLYQTGELFLTEAGLYKVLFSSRKPTAKVFQKWVTKEVLPQIRKTGTYSLPQTEQPRLMREINECIDVANKLADIFNVEGTERIKMIKIALRENKHDDMVKLLPSYQNTKFVGTVGEVSERVAHAYSFHKANNSDYEISARAFNKIAISLGVVITKVTSRGKKFNVIADRYLDYGKNITATQSSTRTQIHWFDDSFDKIYWFVTNGEVI